MRFIDLTNYCVIQITKNILRVIHSVAYLSAEGSEAHLRENRASGLFNTWPLALLRNFILRSSPTPFGFC